MPPRAFSGRRGGHTSDIDESRRPSTTTVAIDFASQNAVLENACGVFERVHPAAANRSGRGLAPSVASNVNHAISFTSQRQQHQQQQRLTLPANARACDYTETDQPYLGEDWSSFPNSIPTPPDPSPRNPYSQPGLWDGVGVLLNGNIVDSANKSASVSSLAPYTKSHQGHKATIDSTSETIERPLGTHSSVASLAIPSIRSRSDSRSRQERIATPRQAMVGAGSSQRTEDGQKETSPLHKKDESLSSSTHSNLSRTSHASFDFSKVDRLAESSHAPGVLRLGPRSASVQGPRSLPDEKGFSIQIGAELFKLSGASIMSDAPSYFSAFFIEQLEQIDDRTGGVRTLFIDRDPETFRDIARHLQGYLITPKDGSHFVKLFADAQFYRLPRLQAQLFESEIFVEIGNENFRIPRDIFSAPGNSPNYFTLGFTVFFSSPGDVFPGLNPRGLLRPPAIHPPRIPNRSPKIFSDILHMLRGYPLTIQNHNHRQQLLTDARYYNLRGLEQQLIPHTISHSIHRQVSEIAIRLQDIKPSQISPDLNNDDSSSPMFSLSPSPQSSSGRWITYARPFVDETLYHLILEISDSSDNGGPISFDLTTMRATFFGTTRSRITNLFQTIANKLNLPTTMPLGLMMMEKGGAAGIAMSPGNTGLSEDKVKVEVNDETHILLDEKEYNWQSHRPEVEEKEGEVIISATEAEELDIFEPQPIPPPSLEIWPEFPPDPEPPKTRNITGKRSLPSPSPKPHSSKRHKTATNTDQTTLPISTTWTIHRGQWRLRVQHRISTTDGSTDDGGSNLEIVMVAVKLEATSGEKARNAQRGWLD